MVGKREGVIKGECSEKLAMTAFGGLAVAEALACRTRLWSDWRRHGPTRCASGNGYTGETVAAAVIHGLLGGGQGTAAAEGLRDDAPLRMALGLEAGVPEEATVWRALGDFAAAQDKLSEVLRRQCVRMLGLSDRPAMLVEGFFPIFGDGTNLEVSGGSKFEGKKTFDGTSKLQWATLWTGPYLAAQAFAADGVGEAAAVSDLVEPVWKGVLKAAGLRQGALFLMDSLYGDGPCLSKLEACEGAHHIVGANKLPGVEKAAAEQPEPQWIKTGVNKERGWAQSAVCVHAYQAEGWDAPRTVVTRRFKREGEMIFGYSSLFTSLTREHPKIAAMIRRDGEGRAGFALAIWRLYDCKQAMENQFKEPLADVGLHHPPCRELARNTAFYGVAALALNLAIGIKRIALEGKDRSMRLWRMRRELFAVAARVTLHARRTMVTLHTSSQRVREMFTGALDRIGAT